MSIDILIAVTGMFVSLLSALATGISIEFIKERIVPIFTGKSDKKKETYSEKIGRLTENLSKASKEVDQVLIEITDVSTERSRAIIDLEKQLVTLSEKEAELKKNIEILEKVPVEAIHQFEKIMNRGERRSAFRDYSLFGLGVLVSTGISIIFRIVGL